MIPRILIIAGSDSGGGAGIQADIKAVTMLGGHAMTAITALTAQNTTGVAAVHPVPAEFVIAQIDAVLGDLGADAVKIGMIGGAETADAVAERLARFDGPIVFDPVMVATSGAMLADAATIAAFDRLLRMATVATPNLPELAALSGMEIVDRPDRDRAVEEVMDRTGCRALLAKGGHGLGVSPEGQVEDMLYEADATEHCFRDARIDSVHTHGTGCTLAGAIATELGRGTPLNVAVARARLFVRLAMRGAPGFGAGHGPMAQQDVRMDLPLDERPMLNQITLPASDYQASVAFYTSLGCKQIVASPPRYARFEVAGGATLSIEVREPADAPSTSEYFFQCRNVDAAVGRLASAGLRFDVLPEDRPYLWRVAETRDPHGNRICLYDPGEVRRFPPWRIGS